MYKLISLVLVLLISTTIYSQKKPTKEEKQNISNTID